MKDTTALTNDDIEKIKGLLTTALVLNLEFAFNAKYDTAPQAVVDLAELTGNDENQRYLANCAIVTTLNVLGVTKEELIKKIVGSKDISSEQLDAIADTSDEDIHKAANFFATCLLPNMQGEH